MIEVTQYHLSPTAYVPNSPRPLLHYRGVLTARPDTGICDPTDAWDLFTRHSWPVQWLYRYGPTQDSHFHTATHECMAVLSGKAIIRFGASDIDDDIPNGIEITANSGDVFVIPAGVAHKTRSSEPETAGGFALLSPGVGHGIDAADPRRALADLSLTGFTMLGAYPAGSVWDFATSGGNYEKVWGVAKPEQDPVFGQEEQGLLRTWPGGGDIAADS